jgi:hypothetical protein
MIDIKKKLTPTQEILNLKQKSNFKKEASKGELLSFYCASFYQIMSKEARLFAIKDIYEIIKYFKKEHNYQESNNTAKNIETTFREIANTLYRTAPNPSNIFFMIDEYSKLLVSGNDDLNHRLIKEIEALMFLVNKFTQLYYQGNGKGQIIYINQYGKKDD